MGSMISTTSAKMPRIPIISFRAKSVPVLPWRFRKHIQNRQPKPGCSHWWQLEVRNSQNGVPTLY
jgi:hypothetical protein